MLIQGVVGCRRAPGRPVRRLAIAALAAIQLTAGKSDAQGRVLGAFFTMLGDAIGLLLAQRAALENP
ncbi:hypothetical protein ACTAZP_23460 [Flavonifractor plautii]|uniref:hypothetical protein n=1 Tax=Flavonifractor plautii TaxID=292800 RepID=UPI003EEB7AE1